MRFSLIHIALALVGVSAEPIAIGRRDANHVPAQSTSQNGTYHFLEKRFDDCRFTYYAAGLGACGQTNTDNDFIVAMNAAQYAGGSHCGQSITISYKGKTAQAKVMDLCPGCPFGGLDFTPALFSYFDSPDKGVITGSWVFGSGGVASKKEAVVKGTTTTSTHKPTTTSTRRATSTTASPRTTSISSTRAPITSRIVLPTTSTTTSSTSTSSPSSTSPAPTTTASSNVAGAVAKPQVSSLIDVINAAVLSLGQLAVAAAQANN